jgi:hypothetical protein
MQVKGETGACGGPVRDISAFLVICPAMPVRFWPCLALDQPASGGWPVQAIDARRTPTERALTDHGAVGPLDAPPPEDRGDGRITGVVRSVAALFLVAQCLCCRGFRMDPCDAATGGAFRAVEGTSANRHATGVGKSPETTKGHNPAYGNNCIRRDRFLHRYATSIRKLHARASALASACEAWNAKEQCADKPPQSTRGLALWFSIA